MPKNTLSVTTPTDREILVRREFDAPREAVWRATTKPELLKRWLFGPPGWEMTKCEEDLRAGGTFRWAWRGPAGEEFGMTGVYSEVVPPGAGGTGGRIVRTERFEMGCGPQAGEQKCTLTLREELVRGKPRTTLMITIVYSSKEARDGAIASGMEHGMAAGYDRLEQMLVDGVL